MYVSLMYATSQDVTHGHADAFTGKTFVFSGVLDSLYRDAAKDLVLSHGGRVTGVLSLSERQRAQV
jgi:BRCT domain type II-containing protein